MRVFARVIATALTAVSAFYFTYLMAGAFLAESAAPGWMALLLAIFMALVSAVFVWRQAGAPGLISSVASGALRGGAIGFALGFFGPLLLTPGANQGPLLGLFITGPLGFLLGAIGGFVSWMRRDRAVGTPKGPRP